MKTIRQVTQKNDPVLYTQLPEAVLHLLKSTAKQNKRRAQDQFIKSLVTTFKNEENYQALFATLLPDVKAAYFNQ